MSDQPESRDRQARQAATERLEIAVRRAQVDQTERQARRAIRALQAAREPQD
ncbi:hypothetical protein [Methylobacterium dankookense]|uniref:Uncharacterized protein n=1 Tax=Methylobacterium dankookense TaxID=560405 RepID=A0A564G506_9HYPH|nr:hypothetical protein [Methylobacterium dankookense]GJD58709.1 hypothetical protein IFDJLNFL_4632 [Methylobacterium dankookense]VUF15162.1 hypothetical protein MTDSW087_04897 [Methylobacterium dankookense]